MGKESGRREQSGKDERLDRLNRLCKDCVHGDEPWYSMSCDPCCGSNDNFEPKEKKDAHLIAGNYEQETAIMLIKAFKDGTPLPKNHGSLKDTDSIIADIYDKYMSSDMKIYNEDAKKCIKMISEAHTVLEAESENKG